MQTGGVPDQYESTNLCRTGVFDMFLINRSTGVESSTQGLMSEESSLPLSILDRVSRLLQTAACECALGLEAAVADGLPAGVESTLKLDGDCASYFHKDAVLNGKTSIAVKGEGHFLVVAEGALLEGCTIDIGGRSALVCIGPGVKLKNVRISLRGENATVLIGAKTTWVGNNNQVLCESSDTHVVIGDDCMFAHACVIRTNDGHSIFDRASQQLVNKPKSIVVKAHVWLANGVRVGKGSIIDSGSVVGQGSIVSGYLESNCVYAGVPARKVREGIVWSRSAVYGGIPPRFR